MLTFLLLPFFLACHVSNIADDSPYRPEYTYRTEIRMVATDVGDEVPENRRAYAIFARLMCRPRDPDTLNCRFAPEEGDEETSNGNQGNNNRNNGNRNNGNNNNGNNDNHDSNGNNDNDNNAETRRRSDGVGTSRDSTPSGPTDFNVGRQPFDLIYDARGVRRLRVNAATPAWSVDMIRAVVGQLHVGLEPIESPGTVDVDEDSYLGASRTRLRVVGRENDRDPTSRGSDPDFQIVPIARFPLAPVVEIVKTRLVEESPRIAGYFFGSRKDYRDPPQDLVAQMQESVSRMIISETNFTSYTDNKIRVNMGGEKIVILRERISLSLLSVKPARTEWPQVSNPVTTGLAVHEYVANETKEEN